MWLDKLRIIDRLIGIKFTEDMLKEFFRKRDGWRENIIKTDKHRWQVIALSFYYTNDYGLSIIAGDGVYSTPNRIVKEYIAVEIALIYKEHLKYLKGKPYFKDVEGYVGFKDFIKIIEFVEGLR